MKKTKKILEAKITDGICDCDDIDREIHCRHLIRKCPFPYCTYRANKNTEAGVIVRKSIRSSFIHFDDDNCLDGCPGHRYTAGAVGLLRRVHGWSRKTNKSFMLSCGIEFWNDDEWVYIDAFRQRIRIEFRKKGGGFIEPLDSLKWIDSKIDRDNNGVISNMDEIIATIHKYKILI